MCMAKIQVPNGHAFTHIREVDVERVFDISKGLLVELGACNSRQRKICNEEATYNTLGPFDYKSYLQMITGLHFGPSCKCW